MKPDPMDQILAAFARGLSSRPHISAEARKAAEEKAHREDPRHQAALKRRRKRKRGGPK